MSTQDIEVNAGVSQGSVLSPTLFLLHINDIMLSLRQILSCADDSTVHGHYVEKPSASRTDVAVRREILVYEVDEACRLQRYQDACMRVQCSGKASFSLLYFF